jgi:hypothetical protein
MNRISLITFLTAAVFLAACGGTAENKPANTTANANTTKPAPAAPTVDALAALDKQANEAYFKGDATYFETFLSDKFGWAEKGKHKTKADVLKEIASAKCDIKDWKMDEQQMSQIDDDTYVLSYKGTADGTCTENGKSMKIPSPIRGASVFVRNGDKWQGAWHGEMPIMEPKADKSANTAKKDETKTAEAAKPEAKKEEPKKAEPAKPETKKSEPVKEDAAKKPAANAMANKGTAANTSANTAPAEAPKPDANTDALVKLELGGWNAWKDKDTKALDSLAYKNLAFIEPSGKWMGNRAEILSLWGTTSGCEKVTKVDVKNGFAWALSPTVEILTFDATADGTCDGQKNGPMNGTSVYVKDGDAWKLAFGVVQPAGHM